ncbi:MAG: hypothetical protein AAF220_02670, partial [Pseudomonadota bacterium]
MNHRLFPYTPIVLFLFLISGCDAGGDIADPLVRKTQWFSYAAATDIRSRCEATGATEYRLIYNADYAQNLRIFEIAPGVDGLYSVRTIAHGAGSLTRLNPLNPLNPWQGGVSRVAIGGDQITRLETAFRESAAFEPAPSGLRLSSEEVYWLFAGCADGEFHYHAWKYPSDAFDAITFTDVVLQWDQTGERLISPERAYQSIVPADPDADGTTGGRF